MWWFAVAAVAAEPEVRATPVVELSAGAEESAYFRWSTELAGKLDGVRLVVQPSGGSGDNLHNVATGRVDVGLVQGDVAWHGWAGSGRTRATPDLVALGVVYRERVHLVTREGELTGVQDLHGKRVDVGGVGSGTLFNGLDALAAAGVDDAELEFQGAFALQRLEEGLLDAAFNTTVDPWDALAEHPGLVDLPVAPEAMAAAPYYELAPTADGGQAVFVAALLVGSADLDDSVVTALLDVAGLSANGVTIPLHPAAEAWYGARGVAADAALDRSYAPPALPELPPPRDAGSDDGLPERVLGVNAVVRAALRENPAVKVASLGQQAADLNALSKDLAWVPQLTAAVEAGGDAEGAAWEDSLGIALLTPIGTSIAASMTGVSSALGLAADWTATSELELSQPLLDGGGLDANLADVRRSRIDAASAAASTEKTAMDLSAAVIKRYWDLGEAYERVALRRDQVDFARRHLNRVEALVQLGQEEQLAVEEARYALMSAERDLLGEQRTLRDAEDALLDDMQARFSYHLVPLGDVVAAAQRALPDGDTVQRRIVTAQLRRPDLRQAALTLQRARVDVAQARNGALPDLTANAVVGSVGEDGSLASSAVATITSGSPYWGGGLEVSLPLGRGADPLAHRAAQLAAQQKELLLDDAMEIVQREVRVAWRGVRTARAQLDVASAAADIADQRHALAIEAFRAGEADSFKVLTYQQDYLDARLAVVAAATDYLQAVAELDRVSGMVLDPYLDVFDAMVKAR